MQRDKERVAAGVNLDRTETPQPGGVAAGPGEFGEPLQYDKAERPIKRRHRLSSTTNPAVKPGPSPFINARFQCGVSTSICSSTKITVAADMLP